MTIPTTAAPSPSWTVSPPHTSKEEGATNFEEGTFQSTMPGKEEGEISITISPRPRPTAITHLTQWRNVNLIMSRPAPRELSLNPLTSTHGSRTSSQKGRYTVMPMIGIRVSLFHVCKWHRGQVLFKAR